MIDEVTWIVQWQENQDRDAVQQLYRSGVPAARALARRMLHRRRDGQDEIESAVADAFLKALRTFKPRQARGQRPFRSWWLTATRSACLDLLRKNELDIDEPGPEDSPGLDRHGAWGPNPTVRAQIAEFEAFCEETYLARDFNAFLDLAEGYSWKEIVDRNPVELPQVVRFEPGQATATSGSSISISSVAHAMEVCPTIEVCARGWHAASGPDAVEGLGEARAERVRAEVETGLEGSTARATGRITLDCQVDGEGRRVDFQVTKGRLATAAAMRMRLNKIRERYRDSRDSS